MILSTKSEFTIQFISIQQWILRAHRHKSFLPLISCHMECRPTIRQRRSVHRYI